MMTAHRYYQLRDNRHLLSSCTDEEKVEFERELKGEARSKAAKRAVQTKRRIYSTWPTRRKDHVKVG